MSTETNNGGPAFPSPRREFVDPYDAGMREKATSSAMGMTLRDYFAAQMLAGLVVDATDTGGTYATVLAAEAYRLADAMLDAREGK